MRMRKPARQQGLIIQCDIPNLEFGILESRDSKPSTTPSAEAASTPPIQGGEHSEFRIWNLELQTAGQSRYSLPSTTPSAEAAAGHPLRGLIREGDAAEIARAFAEIPLDKINEARDLLEGLKNSD